MSDRIPLPQLCSRLKPIMGAEAPSYPQVYTFGLSGLIDLKRDPGKRGYYVLEEELPTIAESIRQARRSKRSAIAA